MLNSCQVHLSRQLVDARLPLSSLPLPFSLAIIRRESRGEEDRDGKREIRKRSRASEYAERGTGGRPVKLNYNKQSKVGWSDYCAPPLVATSLPVILSPSPPLPSPPPFPFCSYPSFLLLLLLSLLILFSSHLSSARRVPGRGRTSLEYETTVDGILTPLFPAGLN